ncbi:TRAP-type C4-dicarboxylate transport system, small permease component [Modicisalibacter muralis]|uniref:TRAP transporter small permease protein n=1 Tax=Modicisalibacter muralis TaxID=119000 RepID=A0A1G9LKN8_9GAMM|nr:TRAP transporter small permease [Halomonas muralis]SDL62532.1 TRAP-type C4-dicarboxylate transport system, small permease component [Halomonas muralis]
MNDNQEAQGTYAAPSPEEQRGRRHGLALFAKPLIWLDRYLEPVIMNIAYAAMVILVLAQVILRFGFSSQIPWGTSVAIYMFIWMAWVGASYNVRQRTHLSFSMVREKLPYAAQFTCLILDAFLWVSMAGVAVYYSIGQVKALQMNFAFVPGSFDMMQWWFYIIMPVSWGLVIFRALQNLWRDVNKYRHREPFEVIGSPLAE